VQTVTLQSEIGLKVTHLLKIVDRVSPC